MALDTPWWGTTPAMAGTRAMNGDASRATTAMRPIAARQPGSAKAILAPTAMRATMDVSSGTRRRVGRRTMRRATTTAPNDAALMAKTSP